MDYFPFKVSGFRRFARFRLQDLPAERLFHDKRDKFPSEEPIFYNIQYEKYVYTKEVLSSRHSLRGLPNIRHTPDIVLGRYATARGNAKKKRYYAAKQSKKNLENVNFNYNKNRNKQNNIINRVRTSLKKCKITKSTREAKYTYSSHFIFVLFFRHGDTYRF